MVDHDLVSRAQRGDESAFAEIAYGMGDRLFTVAQRILRDVDLAEDATQQAIVAIWRELPGLRDPARFEAWSYRVLVNACYAQARAERRRSSSDLRRRPRRAGTRVPPAASGAAGGARASALPRPDPAADRRAARRPDRHSAIAAAPSAPGDARRPRGGCASGVHREPTVMTHDRDLDRMLARWMDDGPTAVADRVVDAALTDVHTTRQRGARWATLKELFMTM